MIEKYLSINYVSWGTVDYSLKSIVKFPSLGGPSPRSLLKLAPLVVKESTSISLSSASRLSLSSSSWSSSSSSSSSSSKG